MLDPATPEEFRAALRGLEGRRCWAVFYGRLAGSIIQLHFEPKLRRAEPLRNRALSEEERWFDGEYALYITCEWRLTSGGAPFVSSDDAVCHPERLRTTLETLAGRRVLAVRTQQPYWDTFFDFTDDLRLHVICDREGDGDDFDLSTATTVFGVGPRGRLTVEPREFD